MLNISLKWSDTMVLKIEERKKNSFIIFIQFSWNLTGYSKWEKKNRPKDFIR